MEHILPYAESQNLLPRKGSVLCALSGGGDSVALLHYLKRQGFSVAAAHFDHHIRPNSGQDAAFCRRFCAELGVELWVGEGEVGAMEGNLEANARAARYAFLEETAEKIGAEVIATAHTASDNLETVLMHLTRGCGLNGLCGIQPRRGKIVRPMLQTTRKAVERYLEENGLEFVTDQTNLDDSYVRNRIRHQVVPVLESVNPRVTEQVSCMTELLRQDEAALRTLAERTPEPARPPSLAHRAPPSHPVLWPPVLSPRTLPFGRRTQVLPGRWAVKLEWTDKTPEFEPKPLEHYLSATKMDEFAVRARQVGDEIHPPNRTGKTVKKWLNELKIPENQRDNLPMMTKNGKLVAAAAIGPDAGALAGEGEPSVHVIWYKIGEESR